MKIVAIRPSIKKLALTKPYTIAYGSFSDVELVLLEIELANGLVGLGSASPAEEVVGETSAQTFLHLQSPFVHELVGRDIRHFRQIIGEAHQYFPHLPGTVAALDIALHDAFGQFLGIPVVDFYGRKKRSLPTSVTIGIKNLEDTVEEAHHYFQLGFKALKVKTGGCLEEDIARIRQLDELFRHKMTIRVDANQGYSLPDLQRFLHQTRLASIELIEQPLPVGCENDLLQIEAADRATIMADESLWDAKAALQLCQSPKPFGIFNIKLMKCGGLLGAFDIANIAQHAGVDLFWGCNDESIISITAALHAAFACPNTRYLDLDGSFDLAEDFVSAGFILENGDMRIGEGAGFGLA